MDDARLIAMSDADAAHLAESLRRRPPEADTVGADPLRGRLPGTVVVRCVLLGESQNMLDCAAWRGEPGWDPARDPNPIILSVAKPLMLRHYAALYGVDTMEDLDPLGRSVRVTKAGFDPEVWRVTPPYWEGCTVYALCAPAGTDSPGVVLEGRHVDLNVDGRAWAADPPAPP